MTVLARRCGALLLVPLLGCAPALNWRDVRPPDSGLQLQFPCKPDALQRQVVLAGAPVALSLHACQAGGLTWGLGHADVGDPARVEPALRALAAAAAGNIGATAGPLQPLPLAGATPNGASGRLRLQGRLPDGAAVRMQVVLFVRGTRVYQATVLGDALAEDAADSYFTSIRFTP